MVGKISLYLGMFFLVSFVFITGCTSSSNAPAAPTTTPTTIQTMPPTTIEQTTLPITTSSVVTTSTTAVSEGKQVLHDTGVISATSFKSYDFKTLMGFKFLYPKDTFRITIKSEKPVLGYAMNTEQARQLQGSQLIPRYQAFTKGVDWGLIEPSMVLEKATDTTKEFTVENVGPLTYVVDGRWMSYDSAYDTIQPFSYEITIVKTGGPTQQNFNF
jgi:hypothetical protein